MPKIKRSELVDIIKVYTKKIKSIKCKKCSKKLSDVDLMYEFCIKHKMCWECCWQSTLEDIEKANIGFKRRFKKKVEKKEILIL